jgi:hypothetical protein
MKTLFKFIAVAIVLLGIETNSFAQLTLTSSATAVIVQTITLAKNYDLHFGNLAVTITAGTCVLTPMAGANPTRTVTGGVTLPAVIGSPRAAEFYVTGYPGYWITISIPTTDITITHTVIPAGNTMIVNTLTTDATYVSPGLWDMQLTSSPGDATFHVGGTVWVGANQLAGVYTNATAFPVTVNYQ